MLRMDKRHLKMVFSVLLLSSVSACGGVGSSLPATHAALSVPASTQFENSQGASKLPTAQAVQSALSPIYINSAGPATGQWVADVDYAGGWTASVTNTIDVSHVASPAPQAPQSVYHSSRLGNFSYTIPSLVAGDTYNVSLLFAETYWSQVGKRIFNVSINGVQDLANFDILKDAGGPNVADAKTFSATADKSGRIKIAFSTVKDNALVTGIFVNPANPSPTPSPLATASPSPSPTSTPVKTTSIPCGGANGDYSVCFTGNTPFHHTVAQLIAAGGAVIGDGSVSGSIASNFWATGMYASALSLDFPMWPSATGDAALPFTYYSGVNIYLPSYAANQCRSLDGTEDACNYDYHVASSDQIYNHGEIDGWQCGPGSSSGGDLGNCPWGALYPYAGSGLSADIPVHTDGAIGGHFAYGLAMVTPGDLSAPAIPHALMIVASCAANPTVYPSIDMSSDALCSNANVAYGDLVAIRPSVNISSLGGSTECQKVLTALQVYGMYVGDTSGGYGRTQNDFEAYQDYAYGGTSPNPWDAHIASMVAAGDGTGSGASFSTTGCLNRIPSASDIEVIKLNQGGTAALPPLT
jgi:hypothetical protein